MRGRSSSSMCCSACCAISMARITSPMSATSPTSTTRSTRAPPSAALSIRELTEETDAIFHEDAAALGCLRADRRAARDRPYRRDDRDDRAADRQRPCLCGRRPRALFDVPSMPDYGALSRRPLDEMIAGARVEVAPYKSSPMDFVLWKPSSAERARLGKPLGARAARLAYRMLGDELEISRRDLRHPRRRHRSRLPASRERNRADALRLRPSTSWRMSGCTTASCRSKARKCRRASAIS